KRMLLSVMVVGMLCSAAWAIAPMGPPAATLDQGTYGAFVGYAHSDMTLEISGPVGTNGGEAVLNDVQHDMYFVGLGYGISNDWSIHGSIGIANAEFPGDSGAPDFEGDNGFAFGIGTKRTLAQDGETKWGVLGQYTQGKSEDNVRVPPSPGAPNPTWGNGSIRLGGGGNVPTKLEWYEVQLALGPTVPLSEDVCVYGGPFLHFAEADLEVREGLDRDEYDLEQKLQLGAYIGTLISLGDPNASLMAELLYTGEGWGFGIAAMFKYP
ncbi:MAG: hypothetical protein ACYTE3_30440, partial [Planctomycetota bacterium]